MTTVKDAIATMAKNIESTTGKPVEKWVALARAKGFSKHGEALRWFKEQHGIGHGYANFLAKETLKPVDDGDEALVDAQFAGSKAVLKPLYDQLVRTVRSFGSDVEIAPKKHNVSVRRSKQFALLQPSTATRLDVGLILKDVPPKRAPGSRGQFQCNVHTPGAHWCSRGDRRRTRTLAQSSLRSRPVALEGMDGYPAG